MPQQTHERWYLVKNESWAGIHLSTLFPRWQNNVESTSIELRRFNVDEPTLFRGWIWLKMRIEPMYLYRRCFNVDKTTLKQHWKNYVDTSSMTQCFFNVDIYLKMNWVNVSSLAFLRRWENSTETALSIFAVLMFTRKWLSQ